MSKIYQSRLNYKLENVETKLAVTSFGGAVLIRDALVKTGLMAEMKKLCLKQAGYADEIILEALILLIASRGRSLSDWEYLSGELGFARLFGNCPSVDTLERYLRRFKLVKLKGCKQGQVGYSLALEQLHGVLIKRAYELAGCPKKLTIDLDATLVTSFKQEAQFSYEMTKAYHPFIAYCPELGLVLAYEFRDGNISPATGYRRITQRVLKLFPKNIQWTLRSDSAGYQNDFLDYLEKNKITYYITAKEPKALKTVLQRQKAWAPLKIDGLNLGEEVALLDYCPAFSEQGQLDLRINKRNYLAIRKPKSSQGELFDDNYSHQVMVTNAHKLKAQEVVKIHRQRCGSVEHCNEQLKSHLGMDKMPSGDFKVNTAYFSLGCLTHNLLRLMQRHLLPESLQKVKIQTLRFRLIRSAALVLKRGRRIILRFCQNKKLFQIFQLAKNRLEALPT